LKDKFGDKAKMASLIINLKTACLPTSLGAKDLLMKMHKVIDKVNATRGPMTTIF
jgi:hypothetical protein